MDNQSPRRRFLKHVSGAIGALSTLTMPAVAGRATQIDSCTTITEPGLYELNSDITHDTSGICIRIRASNVTIDGRGYAIQGAGVSNSYGVSIDESSKNVEVRNLEVTDLTYGFNLVGPRSRFENVSATGNRISGFTIFPAAHQTTITNSDISHNRGGIGSVKADGHSIMDNTIVSNEGIGIVFRQGSSRCTVRRNDISRNGRGFTAWEGGDRNRIVDNVMESNDQYGISINDVNPEHATDVMVRSNTLVENGGDGVFLRQVDNSKLIGNTVRRNDDDGIELESSNRNKLIRNVVCDNGDEAIAIGTNSTDNHLRANTTEC